MTPVGPVDVYEMVDLGVGLPAPVKIIGVRRRRLFSRESTLDAIVRGVLERLYGCGRHLEARWASNHGLTSELFSCIIAEWRDGR